MKLGSSNESVKGLAGEGGENVVTESLLADYSVTPGTQLALRTPRTPASQDYILQVLHFIILTTFSTTNTYLIIRKSTKPVFYVVDVYIRLWTIMDLCITQGTLIKLMMCIMAVAMATVATITVL